MLFIFLSFVFILASLTLDNLSVEREG